jgi:DNA-binding beta-propeller fold protein YncE
MWPAEFDDLLAAIGASPEVAPAPDAVTRCLLIPNPMRLNADPPQPSMAIDISDETISVIDLTSDAVIASASRAEVSAAPAASTRSMPRAGRVATPILVVGVGDSAPLAIGCPDPAATVDMTRGGGARLTYRFAWRGMVPSEQEPAYIVSDADWLAFVDTFGLTPRLDDRARTDEPGTAPLARPKRKVWLYAVIFAAVAFIVAPAMIMVGSNIMYSRQLRADRARADVERPFALPFTGLRSPHGVAVDAAGNVYVADTHTNRVVKLAAGSNTQTVLPFTGLDLCANNIEAAVGGVAVDPAGTVYVTDSCNDRVVMLVDGSSTQTVLPFKRLDSPQGVAVDATGAVYVVSYSQSEIFRLAAGSTRQTPLPASGIQAAPTGNLAVDAAGNVYAGFSKSHYKGQSEYYLLKLAPGASTWTTLPAPPNDQRASFSTGEQDIAVDGTGALYVRTSTDTQGVWKLAPGSTTWTPLRGAPTLIDPLGIAVDAQGRNVYVTDHVGSRATGSELPWQHDDAEGLVLKLPAG